MCLLDLTYYMKWKVGQYYTVWISTHALFVATSYTCRNIIYMILKLPSHDHWCVFISQTGSLVFLHQSDRIIGVYSSVRQDHWCVFISQTGSLVCLHQSDRITGVYSLVRQDHWCVFISQTGSLVYLHKQDHWCVFISQTGSLVYLHKQDHWCIFTIRIIGVSSQTGSLVCLHQSDKIIGVSSSVRQDHWCVFTDRIIGMSSIVRQDQSVSSQIGSSVCPPQSVRMSRHQAVGLVFWSSQRGGRYQCLIFVCLYQTVCSLINANLSFLVEIIYNYISKNTYNSNPIIVSVYQWCDHYDYPDTRDQRTEISSHHRKIIGCYLCSEWY